MPFSIRINATFDNGFNPDTKAWTISISSIREILDNGNIVGIVNLAKATDSLSFNELLNVLQSELMEFSNRLEKIPVDLSRTSSLSSK